MSRPAGAAPSTAAAPSPEPIPFESLDDFANVMWTRFRRRCVAQVDRLWYNFIHHNASGNFASLMDEFQRLADPQTLNAAMPCTEIFAQAAAVVINAQPTTFMAPMCSPLTKLTMRKLTDPAAEYFVNEKSDGLRVVFVSNFVPDFPRWMRQDVPSCSLYDTALLEQARQQLLDPTNNRSESSELRLSFGTHTMRLKQKPAELYTLTLTQPLPHAPQVPLGATMDIVRRTPGRHFSYLFDRRMNTAYLMFDEYPFPNLASVILDGELMISVGTATQPPRALIGVFDIFSYTPFVTWGPDGSAGPIRPGDRVDLQRSGMWERHEYIHIHAIEPLARASHGLTFSVQLIRKTMWPLAELPDLLKQIRRVAGGHYVFRGETFNDGLIFTPNAFDIYAGSHDDQLKWKWPDKLTVDWRLTHNPQPGWYHTYKTESYFRKNRENKPDVHGHTELSRGVQMLNPGKIMVPPGAIAECAFDSKSLRWLVCKVRGDKTDANSLTTLLSVVESIAERLDTASLCELLGLWDKPEDLAGFSIVDEAAPQATATPATSDLTDAAAKSSNQVDAGAPEPMIIDVEKGRKGPMEYPDCHMIVAVQTGNQHPHLKLQWQCRLPTEKNPITCNHVPLRECFGLGEPCPAECPTSQLEAKVAIALANAGGAMAWSDLTAQVYFDPRRGRWGIASLGSDKNKTFASLVLLHLEHVARKSLRNEPVEPPAGADERFAEIRRAEADAAEADLAGTSTALHYAKRTQQLKDKRLSRSPLRVFNNWVKSVLIHTTIDNIKAQRNLGHADRKIAVVDLCSGRGGDLPKWAPHPLSFLFCADSCLEAVGEAALRYSKVIPGLSTKVTKAHREYPGIPAHFEVFDCFDPALAKTIRSVAESRGLAGGFDVVSCQFSMHYAFGNEAQVRGFLTNVSTALRSGGCFIGTTVDDSAIRRWRARTGSSTFGNSCFRVEMLDDQLSDASSESPATASAAGNSAVDARRRFGLPYRFTLEESVAGEVEYVVDWANFTALAESEFQLRLCNDWNFKSFHDDFFATPIGEKLKEKSSKRDHDGAPHDALTLTDDEREAAYLYRAFVFEKF